MTSPWEENQILHDIMDGLGVAIHDAEVNIDYLTSIKLNKLIYLAVNEFDLPITYSWFIYGASLSGGQNDIEVDAVEPSPLNQLPSPEEASIGRSWDYPSPEEYAYYFQEDTDLEGILRRETKSYLREFYRDYAPEEYADLYIASAIFQKSLDEILDMDRQEFNSKQGEYFESLQKEIRSLNSKTLLNSHIEDDEEDLFTSYTYLLMRCFDKLSTSDTEISASQFQKLGRLIKFFYTHSWKNIALGISERTATGPSRREMIRGAVGEFDSLQKNYSADFESLRKSCEEEGLLPVAPEPPARIETRADVEADIETAEAAFENIRLQIQSRDYSSMDPEQFTK